ncbi:MAG TPA: carbohydrate ABC transporter permease [Methylomirabilota bacterium]|jgi:multiple sugar transport system permease protein|nr:carbohydrate ABC transporter permease [Methylomirabilota bacterium]
MIAHTGRRVPATARYATLVAVTTAFLLPTLWILSTSVKAPGEYFSFPPVWIPRRPTGEHYRLLFGEYGGVQYLRNSLIISGGNTLLVLALSIPAAYALARYRVGGRALAFWILAQRMLPPIAVVIPLFLLYARLGLLDSFSGLVLAYTIFNIPLAVWLLIGFFRDFPREIQDQAMVDGCSELGAVVRVILPVIAPGVTVVALLTFTLCWNDLLLALTLTRSSTRTIMVFFTSALYAPTDVQFGSASASIVLGIIPAFVLTLCGQRYLVRGLSMGGVKG